MASDELVLLSALKVCHYTPLTIFNLHSARLDCKLIEVKFHFLLQQRQGRRYSWQDDQVPAQQIVVC
jgi:hypothetical protein